ncbi:hypothetical protein FR932_06965 [Moritella marina ATCC 15381]|uniref:Phage tail protein n=1 Tax=Moritella marina ATCC 15381 TaxID=1202962 RepID=A0A5J6WKJ0_MORMI|nr:phage tail protein [Moritella marina]QFI37600.1 hypothetical protein FR932_06965 [Moritella marina ATCC 15381]
MSQSKLQRLVQYLVSATYKGRNLARAGEFDSWIEGGRIEHASKRINGTGLLAARFFYSGVISINPCNAPVELIATYVSFWLMTNAEKDDSHDVEFSLDINDDNSAEIELTIERFAEDVMLVEDMNGPFELEFQGEMKRFDFGEQSLWIAASFDLDAEFMAQ